MPHVRLIGLVLFITAAFLAMAAAVTHTSHIRFKRYERRPLAADAMMDPRVVDNTPQSPTSIFPPNTRLPAIPPPVDLSVNAPADNSLAQPEVSAGDLQFVSVPVVYPLGFACLLGLMMWFVPAPHPRQVKKRRRRR